ncbi:haloacid dehalogenase-like hydrolase domain-containing 5 isoform X2 [Biomphalaria glabrata]|uniref:Haloacid dehalogenase-like hydrolase domain-containing 5 isoform X2 n=1 Tax=Biomphalaria glabrata TaxID=6526 RepID=A0A9U8E4X3_BIOGL|nr:haloacid dehalogenase-like hydrolase domain-containing 5 isoform X2 [Biomphalaria glabrata]
MFSRSIVYSVAKEFAYHRSRTLNTLLITKCTISARNLVYSAALFRPTTSDSENKSVKIKTKKVQTRIRMITYNLDLFSNFATNADSQSKQVNFGILFDVDGVLARGSTPLDPAKKAMAKLKDANGNLKVPVAFVTNACNRSADKARQIQNWFDINITPEQVIHAPTPAKLLKEFHSKHTLVIGQEHRKEIAADLGFTNTCIIEDIKEAYPLLDMVDHANRAKIAEGNYTENPNFPRVDVVLLIGEPCRWETDLQLIIDLLLTEGKPNITPEDLFSVPQIPVIACNMDLVFMAEACMPRFGHGAFLLCLESLYKKITGRELHYKNLVGKPCEITYRFAEHTVSKIAKQMGISKPIKRLYFFGDNPNVDIVGANLYDRFIKRKDSNANSIDLPVSRLIPESDILNEQTVESCHSMLVGTGVYKFKPEDEMKSTSDTIEVYHGHRDIAHEPELSKPHKYVHDVYEGIDYIFRKEGIEGN